MQYISCQRSLYTVSVIKYETIYITKRNGHTSLVRSNFQYIDHILSPANFKIQQLHAVDLIASNLDLL